MFEKSSVNTGSVLRMIYPESQFVIAAKSLESKENKSRVLCSASPPMVFIALLGHLKHIIICSLKASNVSTMFTNRDTELPLVV